MLVHVGVPEGMMHRRSVISSLPPSPMLAVINLIADPDLAKGQTYAIRRS